MVACMIYTSRQHFDAIVIHACDRHMFREIKPEATDIDHDPETLSIYWIYHI